MPTASCSICFEELLSVPPPSNKPDNPAAAVLSPEKGLVSATPCGHVFHAQCILQWVQQHLHCPQCRRPVVASSLVKLFLAEDQASLRRNHLHHEEAAWHEASVASSAEESLKQAKEDRDDSRIIQDVLQCQLEDLETEVQKLRKQLSLTEDQLQDKVQEVSGLECDLLGARRRELELERRCADSAEALRRVVEEQRLRGGMEVLQRDNAELRNHVMCLGQDAREKGQRLGEVEAELRAKEDVIAELQSQLDRGSSRTFEVHSLYDEEDLRYNSTSSSARRKSCSCLNLCSCVKSTFVILCLLAVILGVFVVLPLKLIFAEEKELRS